jgi:hypothetical protein
MYEYSNYFKKLVSDCISTEKNKINYNKNFWIKFVLVLVAVTFIVANTLFGIVLPDTDVNTIRDLTFELTDPINKYLQNNRAIFHLMLILSSLCIDTVVFSLFIFWVCYGKSWRIFICCNAFYLFRGFIQVSLNIYVRIFIKWAIQKVSYGSTLASLRLQFAI